MMWILALFFAVAFGRSERRRAKDLGGVLYNYGKNEAGDERIPDSNGKLGKVKVNKELPFAFPYLDDSTSTDTLIYSPDGYILLSGDKEKVPEPDWSAISVPFVAVFWANSSTKKKGKLFHRVEEDDTTLLAQMKEDILAANLFVEDLKYAYIITWEQVTYAGNSGPQDEMDDNTFQAVLATDGNRSFFIANYMNIDWLKATTESPMALAGYDVGGGVYGMVPDAGEDAMYGWPDKDFGTGTDGRFIASLSNF